MKSKTLLIRPLEKGDLNSFNHHGYTVRGYSIVDDSNVLGVFGVLHTRPLQAFSEIDDKLVKHPRIIMKAIIQFRNLMKKYKNDVYAIASDKYPNSTGLLRKTGFELVKERLYKWKE